MIHGTYYMKNPVHVLPSVSTDQDAQPYNTAIQIVVL